MSCDSGDCCGYLRMLRVFDRDGNGYITRDELQIAMEMMQENVTETQVNEMLQLADLDKDGKINYEGKREICAHIHWWCSVQFRHSFEIFRPFFSIEFVRLLL